MVPLCCGSLVVPVPLLAPYWLLIGSLLAPFWLPLGSLRALSAGLCRASTIGPPGDHRLPAHSIYLTASVCVLCGSMVVPIVGLGLQVQSGYGLGVVCVFGHVVSMWWSV